MLAAYGALPRKGKPAANEHSVLAGFCVESTDQDETTCVALGTGTRCLPGSRRDADGLRLNDSHAEASSSAMC